MGEQVRDARGRSVTQIDPIALHLTRDYDTLDADVLGKIANEKGVWMAGVERLSFIGGLCGAVAVVCLFVYALVSGDIRNAPIAKSAGLLYLCTMPWIVWYGVKQRRFGNVAAAMLKYERCPHCGYDLRMLPIDDCDGATVCPECGCAWVLPGAGDRGPDDTATG